MRRLLRILAVLGVAAAIAAIVRRLLAERGDAAPAVAPWDELTGNDVVQPAPAVPVEPEPDAGIEVDPGATAPLNNNGSDAGAEPSSDDADESEDTDWMAPNNDGSCPSAFPIKAKLSSKIFHVPGGGSYDRTGADRCYRNQAAAEADGLRQAKR